MNIDRVKDSLEEAKKRFNADLHTENYARVHHDSKQLAGLLSLLGTTKKKTFLDLGTGGGYVAIALAVRDLTCKVVGLDIAEEAIGRCSEAAREQGISNVEFRPFGGVAIPLDNNSVDGVLCRYAFHHFPVCEATVAEISRITRRGGNFVFSDPVRHEEDISGFADNLQRLQKDGHVRIYPKEEIMDLCRRNGLVLMDNFETSVTFSRNLSPAHRKLLDSTPTRVLNAYSAHTTANTLTVRFDIMNAVFLNQKRDPNHSVQEKSAKAAAPDL